MSISNVLLVDDDKVICFLLSECLEHHGFNVNSTSNVDDALKLIASDSFEVLITDLNVPDPGNGIAVLKAMRYSQPNAIMLVLSGSAELKAASYLILLRAEDFLAKPMDLERLLNVIGERLLLRSIVQ